MSQYEIVEKLDEHMVLKRGKIMYIGRVCTVCNGRSWITVIPDKYGYPCKGCNGKGMIVRRIFSEHSS